MDDNKVIVFCVKCLTCIVFLAILVDDRTLVALISKSGNSPDKRATNQPRSGNGIL